MSFLRQGNELISGFFAGMMTYANGDVYKGLWCKDKMVAGG